MSQELEALREAMITETKGYEFYKMAAHQAIDKETREAFQYLANQEQSHLDYLKTAYRDLLANHPLSIDVEAIRKDENHPVFNRTNLGMESGSTAVSVFGIAVSMEKAAVDHYRKAAAASQDPGLKRLYTELARWEGEHLDQMEREYEEMKKDWFVEQGFAPA